MDVNDDNARLNSKNHDRDLWDARLDFFLAENQTIVAFYQYDYMKSFDWLTSSGTENFIDSRNSRVGGFYKGLLGAVKLTVEGAYQFGKVEDLPSSSGLAGRNFDVNAYFGWANAVFNVNKKFKPHLAVLYTSGDGNPNDDKLNGYTAAVAINRFGQAFRGENTILGDGNGVLATSLYGWLPEYVGNQRAYLINGGVFSTARADNPGLSAIQLGVDFVPAEKWLYRSELAYLRWNKQWTPDVAKDLGYEWDNELTWRLNDTVLFKGQASFFFAGNGTKDRTDFLKDGVLDGVGGSDKTAVRVAAELIWIF